MSIFKNVKKLYQQLGEKIECSRLNKKKPVKEMAHLLGLTQSAYRNLERGITALSVSKLFQIADILNERPSDIIDLDEKNVTEENLSVQSRNQMEFYYQLCIQQYKDENNSLKKQMNLLETLLLKKGV